MHSGTINIIMVDDNVQFRTNLKKYIESNLGCKVIAEASNGRELLELLDITNPHIILMDIVMDEMDGIEATKRALWSNRFYKIIAITMHTERIYLQQLIEAGFRGCVFKTDVFNNLPVALKKVMDGELFIPENLPLRNNDD